MRSVGRSSAVAPSARRASCWSISPGPIRTGGSASRPTGAPDLVEALLEHPDAYRVPAIERGLLPLDQRAAQILRSCSERDSRLRLTDDARHALTEIARGPAPRPRAAGGVARLRRRAAPRPPRPQLDPDRRPSTRRSLGRWPTRAGSSCSTARPGRWRSPRPRRTPSRSPSCSRKLDLRSVDPYVERWLERTTTWRGTIEVDGPREAPVFLLLGDNERLPTALRDRATRLPRRREPAADARVVARDRRAAAARLDQPRRQAVRGGARGRAAGAARRARAVRGPRAADVRARAGARPRDARRVRATAGRRGRASDAARARARPACPRSVADPFWVPELDQFIAEHEPWVAPDALARLQEIREEHAHAAGLVALSAATDAALDGPRTRRRAEAVPARRRRSTCSSSGGRSSPTSRDSARRSRRWRRSRPTAPTRRSSSARRA